MLRSALRVSCWRNGRLRVTGGTADSEGDSTRVRCSSDVVSLIERQGPGVLRSGLALREKSCRVVQEEHGQEAKERGRPSSVPAPEVDVEAQPGAAEAERRERRLARDSAEYNLRDEQVEASDALIDEVGALLTEECWSKSP